ncbi:MAG TPA: RuvX/YqgF family protein [bacterium]|nr:RuvX/YqgF family protein [bacterium]
MNEPLIFLGIDWGASKIGLAIGDSQTKLALPYGRVASWSEAQAVIAKEQAQFLVIGWPRGLLDKNDKINQGWTDFVKMARASGLPVELVDERLSTQAADRLINHQKAAADQDAIAAMLILQGFLDQYEPNH